MPKYHRKPWSENRGKRILICELTGISWNAWKCWCRWEGHDLYCPDALRTWLRQHPKVLDNPHSCGKENQKKDGKDNEGKMEIIE